jgi:hypothetical protein
MGGSAVNAIRLINSLPGAVEFRVIQDKFVIARITVSGNAEERIPITTEYTAHAFTTMGGFKLTSNQVSFKDTSITLKAQVLVEHGFYDFELVALPGMSPSAITLENTSDNPVQFELTQPNTPVQIVTVVDEHNYVNISTAQQWTIDAVVNELTTNAVVTDNPDATISVASDGQNGYFLTVS